jgi:hypothetical protein
VDVLKALRSGNWLSVSSFGTAVNATRATESLSAVSMPRRLRPPTPRPLGEANGPFQSHAWQTNAAVCARAEIPAAVAAHALNLLCRRSAFANSMRSLLWA